MRMTQAWIEHAHETLRSVGIVDDKFCFPEPFKGYFSSFGAAVAQSGLLAASLFYEGEDHDATANRSLVVKAVVELLHNLQVLSDEEYNEKSLAKVVANSSATKVAQLLPYIDQAVAALKVSLRDYCATKQITKELPAFGLTIERDTYEPEEMAQDDYEQEFPVQSADGANMGWLFYRDYYADMDIDPYPIQVGRKVIGTDQEIRFRCKNQRLLSSTLGNLGKRNAKLIEDLHPDVWFDLTTIYPGLLIGSGLAHGTGMDQDLKIGLSFDYTTGLPYVAGSAVKGVLRSLFPSGDSDESNRQIAYLCEKCPKVKPDEWRVITKELFDVNGSEVKRSRPIFFDAMIVATANKEGKILGDDFITPHKSPIKHPIPLQFLKVLPAVTFRFAFRIGEAVGSLQVNEIGQLFQSILLDVGVGAKTHVGYGQFVASNH